MWLTGCSTKVRKTDTKIGTVNSPSWAKYWWAFQRRYLLVMSRGSELPKRREIQNHRLRALSTIKRPVVDPAIWRSGGPRHWCACSGHLQPRKNRGPESQLQIDVRPRGSRGWPLRRPPLSLSTSLPMLAHTCRAVPHQ
jgi:hypothetical protein